VQALGLEGTSAQGISSSAGDPEACIGAMRRILGRRATVAQLEQIALDSCRSLYGAVSGRFSLMGESISPVGP
jgi:hypothetical protein